MTSTVGIDSISFYIPESRVSIKDILFLRSKESKEFFERLTRAQINTQQSFIRLTKSWQDSATIAAQSAISLIKDNKYIDINLIKYLVSATETPLDASKPLSAFILGIIKKISNIPYNLVNYQTQHACAGGTISLLQIMALINSSSKNNTGIVTMSDIARYQQFTTAEITQGAGAVSALISKSPKLLEVNINNIGYASEDVDDFFRPLNSPIAQVRGRYSMQCYIDSTYNSLQDYAQQCNKSILEIIENSDYIVCHTPFPSMPEIAISSILRKKLKLSKKESHTLIEKKKINASAEIVNHIGNTYTAAAYFPLAYLLEQEYKALQSKLIKKRILLLSYGAGNTSIVLQATVAPHAGEIITSWNLASQLNTYTDISAEDYVHWCNNPKRLPIQEHEFSNASIRDDYLVFLEEIRDDQYRIYNIKK